jgi:hypothetical protein
MLVKGSTLFVTDKLSEKGDKSVEAGVDYLSKDVGSLNLKVISPLDFDTSKIDVYTAFVGFYKGFSLGGDCRLNVKNFKASNCNAILEYVKNDVALAFFGKYEIKGEKKKRTFGVGYHQNINESIRSSMDYSFEQISSISTLRLGSSYKFDENSSLKSRIVIRGKRDMRLGLVLKQNIYPSTKLTFSSDLNTRLLLDNTSGDGAGHQFGVTLSFF